VACWCGHADSSTAGAVDVIQEQFPESVDFQTEHTRLEMQGNALTCTAFGVTSALEAILHRSGKFVQLSPRFLWWLVRGQNPSVEVNAAAIENEGICLEDFCPYITSPNYPYEVIGLYAPPAGVAWEDAKTRLPKGIKPRRIAGKESVMRALSQGSALTIIKVLGGSIEHCCAVIGYNSFGIKVHDSGNNIYYQPWADLEMGGNVTQIYRWYGLPLVPDLDYVEGDLPTLANDVLSVPRAMCYVGWPQPSLWFKNLQLKISSVESMSSGNDDVRDFVFWHSGKLTLYIPKLIAGGKVLENVKLVKPTGTLISAEEDTPKEQS